MKKKIQYAIGEIILVVVGILIAVSINNWNENRKVENKLLNIFKMVKSDMISDTIYTHQAIWFYNFQDSLAKIVIKDTVSKAFLKENMEMMQIPFNNVPFTVSSGAIEQLKKMSADLDLFTDSTIATIIQFQAVYSTSFKDLDEKLSHDVQNNTDHIKTNSNYFSLRQEQNLSDDYLDYFLTDDFKNRVVMHQKLTARNSVMLMKQFNANARILILEIDKIIAH
ncbi:hypothetical protein DNU06_06980 [Putridiphycobacter roseus]|uniref:Uncharacterized protein n=1 Tax=Putridiphycobacter roseus TaxID=2219161 RepID=A0A2W1NI14_9FLAO|nr:DUF6090 family protein [Putridiphycobacter roseus]PZE17566.1 hypothetical protein DNU06_06980 [Putridiphycobacter roseus]